MNLLWRLKNNPKTNASDGTTYFQLALNTAQVGRTFQDRSHVFLLKSRTLLPEKYRKSNIYYIAGMGKRGNIVETYPAMEYRFFPERISVTTDDVICFVWSGKKYFISQVSWYKPFKNATWFDIRASRLKTDLRIVGNSHKQVRIYSWSRLKPLLVTQW